MGTNYPKNGLQDRVAFQQNGKPGTYPVQAWNDEIGTFQFLSSLADGTKIPAGAAVVMPVANGDGVRLPAAGDLLKATDGSHPATVNFVGVVAFGQYITVQDGAYCKNDIDPNLPVKQKGYITVLMTNGEIAKAKFETLVCLDLANPGYFKVAGAEDVVVGKVNKIFPEYGTCEIELKELI